MSLWRYFSSALWLALPLTTSASGTRAVADTLVLSSPTPNAGEVIASYHLDQPATGKFTLLVAWTDSAGRLMMQRAIPQELDHTDTILVTLDLRRAVAMDNRLEARLVSDGSTVGAATAAFVVSPREIDWTDYPIIIWQDQTSARAAGLRRLGINAGRVFGTRGLLEADEAHARVAPLIAAGLRFYVENIATDFYAAYHRFQPDHPIAWAFDEIRALAARDLTNPAIFRRQPSLSDPAILATIRARLAQHVKLFGSYRPLYYSLGDETGIADLAAAWDFDLGPASLDAMRAWLRARYGTLAALNAQWGQNFSEWDAVMPMTTSEAIRGPADNFSAWSDFKEAMDAAFASAVQAGAAAIHAADPRALAGIEGAQVPGWGGYDYTKLAPTVDVMELYDSGNNIEIVRALNPGLKVLTTLGTGSATEEAPQLWHELLLGSRGLIIWDEAGALVDDFGRPRTLGRSSGAVFAEFRDGLAMQLGNSTPTPDPVAILYSPASFRIDWLLGRRADGQNWMARGSEIEGRDSPLRASMRVAAAWLVHLGLQPRWVSEDGLADALRSGTRVLLLPHTIALSPEAVTSIQEFADAGGLVLADEAPGLYDAHGRRRPAPPLQNAVTLTADWPPAAHRLRSAGVTAAIALTQKDGTPARGIDTRILHNGAVFLIGLQRDSATSGGDAGDIVLTLAQPGQVYDVRRHTNLGWTDRFTFPVGATEPAVVAISPAKLPGLFLHGPVAAATGTDVDLQIGQSAASPAAARVVHIETRGPDGHLIGAYSGNLILHGGPVSWHVPLALNDPPGRWTIAVSDRLGDSFVSCTLDVATADVSVTCASLACPGLSQ